MSDPVAIMVREEKDGRRFILNSWPETTAVTPLLFGTEGVSAVGDLVSFSFQNGSADYRKVGESLSGSWICERVRKEAGT